MDEPWKAYAKWKKPDMPRIGEFIEMENKLVVTNGLGWESREVGSDG